MNSSNGGFSEIFMDNLEASLAGFFSVGTVVHYTYSKSESLVVI